MQAITSEEVKTILRECDHLHRIGKYEEALDKASQQRIQKCQVELLPYVLEMQVRNMISLLQYSTALKLIEETLRYLPSLRDFIYRKAECEIALGKVEEARKCLIELKGKIKEDASEGGEWMDKVDRLLKRIEGRGKRDLTRVRVYFKEEGGDKVKKEEYLKKGRDFYTAELEGENVVVKLKSGKPVEDQVSVDIRPKQLKVRFPTQDGKSFYLDIDLFGQVIPENSSHRIVNGVVEITLAKLNKELKWDYLEEQMVVENLGANKANLSHTQKRWDQICTLIN
jgi:HSP20 family molecular chaperone IbpA